MHKRKVELFCWAWFDFSVCGGAGFYAMGIYTRRDLIVDRCCVWLYSVCKHLQLRLACGINNSRSDVIVPIYLGEAKRPMN